MSHKANLVIVNEMGYELYSCYWCATGIETAIFWGPELAETFIRETHPVSQFDTIQVEGGILLDIQRKVLIFWNVESNVWDIPQRHLFLQLMQYSWTGWTIQWAYQGIADILGYIGYPDTDVLIHRSSVEHKHKLHLEVAGKKPDSTRVIASIRLKNGNLRFLPLTRSMCYVLWQGWQIVEPIIELAHTEALSLNPQKYKFPCCGFHINVTSQTLHFWLARIPVERLDSLKSLWEGWTLHWVKDHYLTHMALTDNHLHFTTPSPQEWLNDIREILLPENRNDYDMYQDVLEYRTRIFEEVVNKWRKEHEETSCKST